MRSTGSSSTEVSRKAGCGQFARRYRRRGAVRGRAAGHRLHLCRGKGRRRLFRPGVQSSVRSAFTSASRASDRSSSSDSSHDGRKLLIHAGSDRDPGRYYLFDRDKKSLTPAMVDRPELEGRALASVKPVTITAPDGAQIPAYLTLPPGKDPKNLPAVVLPHGGPSARDYWGFDWLAQFLAARGYAVIQPEYRGSAGWGDAWLNQNGFKNWRTSIGDITASANWLSAAGHRRSRPGCDPRLVLRRLCRAAVRGHRADALQGCRCDRARHRPCNAEGGCAVFREQGARRARDRSRSAHRRRFAPAPCGGRSKRRSSWFTETATATSIRPFREDGCCP